MTDEYRHGRQNEPSLVFASNIQKELSLSSGLAEPFSAILRPQLKKHGEHRCPRAYNRSEEASDQWNINAAFQVRSSSKKGSARQALPHLLPIQSIAFSE